MESALTGLLKDFLHQFTLRSSHSEYSRLVLGGLPSEVLGDLFSVLTQGDGSLWQHAEGIQIPVFLVTGDPKTDGAGLSRECNWDYALAIRNSFPSFLLLVDPSVWDDRTYSIINATDTIGLPLPPIRGRRNVPALRNWSMFYANVVEMAAGRIGIESSIVESAIREALGDLPSLDPTQQHLLPWQILERITSLSNSGHAATPNDLARVCGLLPLAADEGDFRRSRRTLERLADFLEDAGIEDGIQELKETSSGSGLGPELDAIGTQLRVTAGSASAVVRAPSYYLGEGPDPSLWGTLTVEVTDEMLAELGQTVDPDRISVSCINPLNSSPSPGEPLLVQEEAVIEARHPGGTFQSLRILRRLGRQNPTVLTTADACQSPVTHKDAPLPAHSAPVTYLAEAHGATPASVQVICLANYVPGGFVTCPGTSTRKVTRPRKTQAAAPWQQQIFLRSGGLKVLRVFCGSTVSKVRITEPSELQVDRPVNGGVAELQVELDDDVEITLDLRDPDNQLVSAFVLAIAIDQDQGETVPSQFHALVQAHQENKSTVSAARSVESWLRGAERELLNRDSSWRPILATSGWADSSPRLTHTRLLGGLQPQGDPRPVVNPPADFIEARGRVVSWLCSSPVPIPEADLANDEANQLAADYLRAYREWGRTRPFRSMLGRHCFHPGTRA